MVREENIKAPNARTTASIESFSADMEGFHTSLQTPCPENSRLQTNKRICLDDNSNAYSGSETPTTTTPSMQMLPALALSEISNFADNVSLSGACRATLGAAHHELHIKLNIIHRHLKLVPSHPDTTATYLRRALEPQQSGRLASGRRITRITVTRCGDGHDELRYKHVVEAIRGIIRQSLPRAAFDHNRRQRRKKPSRMISAILGGLVHPSAKHQRVAPNLTRIVLRGASSAAVMKAGEGVAAGLWPALEELDVFNCRANPSHFSELAHGLSTGQAQNLRALNWGRQAKYNSHGPLDVVLLSALSMGRCPRIEFLSFTGNQICLEWRIDGIVQVLNACPNLGN